MTRRALAVVVLFCVCVFGHIANAATPSLMNYQGILTDGSGTPITIATTVEFRIWSMETGGIQLWMEPRTVTPEASGRFNVLLGSVNPLSDGLFADSSRYLGITVGADPELSPRTRIATVAYAFRPSTVDGASGGQITGTVDIVAGNLSLESSTPTTGNITKSGTTFIHDLGSENTFIGRNAGNLTSVGSSNTGSGYSALRDNTIGGANTANGANALKRNTSGFGNTAIGSSTMLNNISGTDNTACGASALSTNEIGNNNTALGRQALQNNFDGDNNTATGFAALLNNTSGNDNTADGLFALLNNTIGEGNTAIGRSALESNTEGANNTASGFRALFANATGLENTASGFKALESNTEGNHNTAIGANSLNLNTIGESNTAVGDDALALNSSGGINTACGSSALSSNTTGGANTATGVAALQFNTTGDYNTAGGYRALDSNTTGSWNTAIGTEALYYNKTGTNNTALGMYSLQQNVTGNFNTAIGYYSDVNDGAITNATAIGANAKVDASNKIRLGDANVTVIEGQVAYTFTSDENAKENFRPVDGDEVLRKLRKLNLASWNYKGHDPEQFRHYGPVAQEFFEAFGHDGIGTSGTPTTINSGDQAGILMIAVQALERRNQELEATIAEMKSRLERLEGK